MYKSNLKVLESLFFLSIEMSSNEVLMASSGSVATPYCIIMQLLSCVDVDGRPD